MFALHGYQWGGRIDRKHPSATRHTVGKNAVFESDIDQKMSCIYIHTYHINIAHQIPLVAPEMLFSPILKLLDKTKKNIKFDWADQK